LSITIIEVIVNLVNCPFGSTSSISLVLVEISHIFDNSKGIVVFGKEILTLFRNSLPVSFIVHHVLLIFHPVLVVVRVVRVIRVVRVVRVVVVVVVPIILVITILVVICIVHLVLTLLMVIAIPDIKPSLEFVFRAFLIDPWAVIAFISDNFTREVTSVVFPALFNEAGSTHIPCTLVKLTAFAIGAIAVAEFRLFFFACGFACGCPVR